MNENVTEGGERKQRYCYGVRLRLHEEKQILLPYWQALHELINPIDILGDRYIEKDTLQWIYKENQKSKLCTQ